MPSDENEPIKKHPGGPKPKARLKTGVGSSNQCQQWNELGTSRNSSILNRYHLEELKERELAREYARTGKTRTLDDVVKELRGLPFYRWDFGEDYEAHNKLAAETDNNCCAVHKIGIPENKPGLPTGFFPYEKTVFDAMQVFDNLWIKKATGLGISEFYLYYFLWEACKDDKLKGTQICFITGPRLELTVMLMDRLKNLPILRDVAFNFKSTVFEINGVRFEAFPSNNLDSARGLPKPSRFFLDEADFWEVSLQDEARTIAERYIAKSRARIVMVSTPGRPNGLFDKIEHEDDETCQYYRIFLHYTLGVGYIYTEEDIAKAKRSPSFPREFGLEYLGTEGDVFIQEELERAIELGNGVDYSNPSLLNLKSMGIDPGYSNSKYAICITNYNPKTRKVEIIYAHEFSHASPTALSEKSYELALRYNVTEIFIDGSQNGQVRELKKAFGERYVDYDKHVTEVRAQGKPLAKAMKVVPVAFNAEGSEMITKCQALFNREKIAIPEVFRDLIVQLRSATLNTAGKLDKKEQPMDLFDAFRLAIHYYNPWEQVIPSFITNSSTNTTRVGPGGLGDSNNIFGI